MAGILREVKIGDLIDGMGWIPGLPFRPFLKSVSYFLMSIIDLFSDWLLIDLQVFLTINRYIDFRQ